MEQGEFEPDEVSAQATVRRTRRPGIEDFLNALDQVQGTTSGPEAPRLATMKQRKTVYLLGKGICNYCEVKVNFGNFQVDHRIPFSKGGQTVLRNLVSSCVQCNVAKGSMDAEEFMRRLAEDGLAWRDEQYLANKAAFGHGD